MRRSAKNISAVIFDLDGTLIDSSEAIVECFQFALRQTGHSPSDPQLIRRNIGTSLERMFSLFTKGDTTQLVRLYRERYRQVFLEKTYLLPEVKETLDALSERGYRLGVATTKPRYFAEPILENLGIRRFFDAVAGGEEVGQLKPAPDLLQLALSRLVAPGDETLYVGDHPVDVEAARSAGLEVICVATGFWTRDELEEQNPTAVISNLPELLPLLRNPADD
jgi:phosphoglycolate phosphatase